MNSSCIETLPAVPKRACRKIPPLPEGALLGRVVRSGSEKAPFMIQSAGKLLAIGLRDPWPEPLHGLVARGELHMDVVPGIYQAAARLATDRASYLAILIDSDLLTHGEVKMVSVLKRHLNLPLWVLPGARRRSGYLEALTIGALPLEDVVETGTFLLQIHTHLQQQGSRENVAENNKKLPHAVNVEGRQNVPGRADNAPVSSVGKVMEIPVTAGVATRYDETVPHVALTEREVRALLGSAE